MDLTAPYAHASLTCFLARHMQKNLPPHCPVVSPTIPCQADFWRKMYDGAHEEVLRSGVPFPEFAQRFLGAVEGRGRPAAPRQSTTGAADISGMHRRLPTMDEWNGEGWSFEVSEQWYLLHHWVKSSDRRAHVLCTPTHHYRVRCCGLSSKAVFTGVRECSRGRAGVLGQDGAGDSDAHDG